MIGLLHHLILTFKLNFRSKQAIIYGYVVPIFFLVAFGVVFSTKPPLLREMGALITVTVLGGACFGMPTAMVAERERGVWRRYRLLPTAIGGIITSAMVVRFIIVLSAAVMQVLLAHFVLKTPWPDHPIGFAGAFVFVCFSFLGLGLVIAMTADNVPAVQALGQAIFLPMIMIGGVGVPLELLPNWVQHVAAFFPGRYAVSAIQACQHGPGLASAWFDLAALSVIGIAGIFAGSRLFRWDMGQKLAPGAKGWVAMAVATWAVVGLSAEATGRLKSDKPTESMSNVASLQPGSTTQPTASNAGAVTSSPVTTQPAMTDTQPAPASAHQRWEDTTQAQIDSITYDDLPPDQGTVVPMAVDLNGLDDDSRHRMESFNDALIDWPPAQAADVPQRIRNLLSVCAVADVAEDPNEAQIPLVVFNYLRGNIQKDQLIKALAYVAINDKEGLWLNNIKDIKDIKELSIDAEIPDESLHDRGNSYARKFLFRLLNKKIER